MSELASKAGTLAGRMDGIKTRLEATADKAKGNAIKGVLGWLVLQSLVASSVLLVLGGAGLALGTIVPLPSALAGIGALVLGGIVTAALLLARPR